ncbi:28779_t:CDS:2 [Racocetra persica]|uniref:28779_t:CDS:1 n=1 Tax=Racocetra persica TaxID=160502 RepID=A0ACA9QJX3_9GLOM|nr:28779_t:CDS:2 [Racocetra persica]
MSGSPSQYRVNDNGSVNLPFGRAVKTYINSLPLLTNCKLKKQSRLYVNQNIKTGLITLKRVEGAIDYLSWKTIQGQNKSMNRLDDIIELTNKGHERVAKIKQNAASDLTVWHWVFFVMVTTVVKGLVVELGNCAVRVIIKVMLSDIEELFPVQLFVKGIHGSQHMPVVSQSKVSRINLSLQARDHAIMAYRAHHSSGVEIVLKLLAPYNNTSEIHLRHMRRSRSDEEAIMMGKEYRNFVYFLPLDNNIKDLLAFDLEINWICDE